MFALNLFTRSNCALSEIVSFMLNEKGINFRNIVVDSASGAALCESVFQLVQAPALADHDVRLVDLDHIIEYIDERFPYPAMMPSGPSSRASTRLMMRRILRDLYPLLDRFQANACQESADQLSTELNSIAPLFNSKPFVLSDEFSVLDAVFVPLIQRINPHVSLSAEIKKYLARLTSREAYKKAAGTEVA